MMKQQTTLVNMITRLSKRNSYIIVMWWQSLEEKSSEYKENKESRDYKRLLFI